MTDKDPRVVVVVPWRPGDPDREKAWAYCREWWNQFGWDIYEVEHTGSRPFNRSWCINEGARRAGEWDVIVAIDADVFEEDPQQVYDGVILAWETGKLVVPHIVGADLTEQGVRALIKENHAWPRCVKDRRDPCTSRVTIVRRDVFERVGGFDTRFEGWGHEDVAFWASAVSINGVEQLPGTCYHLWHKPSFPSARRSPQWIAGSKLADRYLQAFRNGIVALDRVLAERADSERYGATETDVPPPGAYGRVDVIVLTAGRRAYLTRTLESFNERVSGEIGHRTIQDDSGDPEFGKWLKGKYGDVWEIITTAGKIGFTEAIRSLWDFEMRRNGDASPYIFHLEEDFVFDVDIELNKMITVLEHDHKLAQVALLRGPWAPPEHEAGGIIEQNPHSYTPFDAQGVQYLRHRRYFTTNPCLYRRELLKRKWPKLKDSEVAFTKQLRARGMFFAYLGTGTPMVTHIGDERVGIGY